MALYTQSQIVSLAESVGFSPSSAQTISAIALAESGGNSHAISPRNTNGTTDYGLVQINSVHFSEGAITQSQALDPIQALKYALKLSSGGTNFNAWSTFTNGAYLKYGAAPASNSVPTKQASATQPASPSDLGTWFQSTGSMLLLFVVAVTILIFGFMFLVK